MPLRNVATNYTFEQQRQEINLLAADVDSLSTSIANQQGTETTDSPSFNSLYLGSTIYGPALFTIDPATHGDDTGTLVIKGNLQIDGTTTTVNSTIMSVNDLNITLADGASNAAAADGAGLTIDGAGATFTFDGTNTRWVLNAADNQLRLGSGGDHTTIGPDSSGHTVINAGTSGGNLSLQTAGSDRLKILSTGLIGINETNPATELEVGGSVWLKRSSSDQFADQFRARKDRGGQAVQDGDTVLTIMAQGFSSAASSYRDLARIDFEVDGTPQAGFADMPGSVVFKLGRESLSSLQETLRLHSSGQLTLNLPTNTTSRHIGIVNSAGTIGWTFGNGVVASARQFVIYDNEAGAVRLKIDASGTVSDSMGPLRSLGVSTKTSAYQLGLGDVGRMIVQTGNSQSVTIPNGFSAGDMITIVNQTATNINLVQGTGLTLYNTADASTGTRTLAQRGASTVVFTDSNTAYISGSGLS